MFPADATVPELYRKALAAIDTLNTGKVSVSALSRVLASSALPAATIDRVLFFANRFLNMLIGFYTRLSTWLVQGPEYPVSNSL